MHVYKDNTFKIKVISFWINFPITPQTHNGKQWELLQT